MSTYRSFKFTRLIGFLLVPVLSAVAPLVVLPVITASFGGEVWAAVAVAQSLGSAGAVLVELGWGLNGPQRVARASASSRAQIYSLALVTKCLVTAILVAPVLVVTAVLAPSHPLEAQLIAVGYLLTGLSPVWFYIGEGRPVRILLFDALPRLLGAVIPAVLIASLNWGLVAYAVGLLVSSIIAPVIGLFVARARVSSAAHYGVRRLVRIVRAQGAALGGRAASALYIALPITLVGVAAPSSLVLFSAMERMMRLGLGLLASVPNSLQAWVGSPPLSAPDQRQRRVRVAILINVALGFVAAATFTVLAPFASTILFSGTANVPHSLAALAGIVIFITCTSRATGSLGLVAYRRIPAIAVSALIGAAIGVPAILLLSAVAGTPGAFVGEILAEGCVLIFQLYVLTRSGLFRRAGRSR